MKSNQLAIVVFLLLGFSCTSENNEANNQDVNLPPKLKSVTLERGINEQLFTDLSFNLNGNYGYVKVNRNTSRENLIPSFDFEGKNVYVNDEVQTSGNSSHNFTSPVT